MSTMAQYLILLSASTSRWQVRDYNMESHMCFDDKYNTTNKSNLQPSLTSFFARALRFHVFSSLHRPRFLRGCMMLSLEQCMASSVPRRSSMFPRSPLLVYFYGSVWFIHQVAASFIPCPLRMLLEVAWHMLRSAGVILSSASRNVTMVVVEEGVGLWLCCM